MKQIALYDLIKADLPITEDEPLFERTKNHLGFRVQMVEALK